MANPDHERALYAALQRGEKGVDFRGQDLSGLVKSSIRLAEANLAGCDLRQAVLTGGYFTRANLAEARLGKSNLTTTDFREAILENADLTGADLSGAVLSRANLRSAILCKAKLVKVRLDGANLESADLKGADLRGAQGLTSEMLAGALNVDKAILDVKTLSLLGRQGDPVIAQHGKPVREKANPQIVDLYFTGVKPTFGDVFLMCGLPHPKFAPTGDFGFAELADLGIEQVDDFFAVVVDGDPVIWIQPLIKGDVVFHHPGPFEGIRLRLEDGSRRQALWKKCVAAFRGKLRGLEGTASP